MVLRYPSCPCGRRVEAPGSHCGGPLPGGSVVMATALREKGLTESATISQPAPPLPQTLPSHPRMCHRSSTSTGPVLLVGHFGHPESGSRASCQLHHGISSVPALRSSLFDTCLRRRKSLRTTANGGRAASPHAEMHLGKMNAFIWLPVKPKHWQLVKKKIAELSV